MSARKSSEFDTGQAGVVYVVDDDQAIRHSLTVLFESIDQAVEAFESIQAFLENYDPLLPAVLLLDLRMPSGSGLLLQQQLLKRGSDLPIIFMSAHADLGVAVEAMKQGAVDFLTKPVSAQLLLDKTHSAIEQHRRLLQTQRQKANLQQRMATLTERELEVFELLIDGLTNKRIAEQLDLSHRTVEVHRSHIFDKLDCENAVELLHFQLKIHGIDSAVTA